MNKQSSVFWAIAMMACSFAGCSDDASRDAGVPVEPVTSCEETGSCETPEDCTRVCPDPVENQCDETGMIQCQINSDGCAVWKTVGECPSGTHCDSQSSQCVAGCTETCNPDALVQCTPDGIDYCETDSDGCAVHHVEPCDEQTVCDETLLTCVSCIPCEDNNLKRCTAEGVETCSNDDRGCGVWSLTDACKENQSCDANTWTCVDGCTNACTEGEKKCENNSVYTCSYNQSGCLAWSAPEACGTGQICNNDKKVCEYFCGNDCDPFSIILLPDTQYYSVNQDNEPGEKNIYTRQMKWIKENEKKENIRAMIHLGDVTETNCVSNWELADYAHKNYIDNTSIPYAISTGNHDYNWGHCGESAREYDRDITRFGKYFGPDRFKGKSWYHASPYDANSYITFSVGNIKFLVIALEYIVRQDVLCWANELIQKYPDHHVIIETHGYLGEDPGKYTSASAFGQNGYVADWSKEQADHGAGGFDIYHGLVARHNNIFMAVCGHVGEDEWRQKKAYNGNTVTEMIVDYQYEHPCKESTPSQCKDSSCKEGRNAGNGWMRQLIFDPKTNKIKAKTFTVLNNSEFAGGTPAFYCEEYNSDVSHSDHQFSFSADFTTPVNYKFSDNNYIGFATRNINGEGFGEQLNPAVAVHRTTGTMVAVWEDDSSDKDGTATAGAKKDKPNHDIAARIFYRGGCQKVAQFTVHTDTAGDQMTPAVAMDKNGNFVVVWADDSDGNGYYDVMMRGFDENGKERIKTTVVHSNDDKQQLNPSIAMAPDGRFVIAWEDNSVNADNTQIYVRGFDANGKPTFADRNVDTQAGTRQKPSVGIADNGSFVVTWQDDTDMNGYFDVCAKGFNADGSDRIKLFTVNTLDNGQQLNPAIAMNGSGVFYIAYEDDEDKNGLYRVKSRGFKADGSVLSEDGWVSDAGEDGVEPALCVNDKNEVVYVWTARALNSGDIRRRAYRNGKLEANHNVNVIKDGVQNQPAIACTNDGRSAVLWHEDMDGNGYYEIFGRGFNEM
ncbi:MAG: metallophosphoesterase [Proteobacteria bacterium]|nr:metallophosphoesterase [Pseudomonadota bacterium]